MLRDSRRFLIYGEDDLQFHFRGIQQDGTIGCFPREGGRMCITTPNATLTASQPTSQRQLPGSEMLPLTGSCGRPILLRFFLQTFRSCSVAAGRYPFSLYYEADAFVVNAKTAQHGVERELEDFEQVLGNVWLGRRDSNPDTQIQSHSADHLNKEDKALSSANQGEPRQNPQRPRNKK